MFDCLLFAFTTFVTAFSLPSIDLNCKVSKTRYEKRLRRGLFATYSFVHVLLQLVIASFAGSAWNSAHNLSAPLARLVHVSLILFPHKLRNLRFYIFVDT